MNLDFRDIFETNHITLETADTRMTINSETNFEQELRIKSLSNLDKILTKICAYLQEQDGLRKICILTDGSTKHSNLTKIDSNIINKRFIIHIGDKNSSRTREVATKINFQFGSFNSKTLEVYVQHFLTYF